MAYGVKEPLALLVRRSLLESNLGLSTLGLSSKPCRSVCLCVCRSVLKVYCGKTAEWVWMPFGVVSGVGPREMSVLDAIHVPQGEWAVLGVCCPH